MDKIGKKGQCDGEDLRKAPINWNEDIGEKLWPKYERIAEDKINWLYPVREKMKITTYERSRAADTIEKRSSASRLMSRFVEVFKKSSLQMPFTSRREEAADRVYIFQTRRYG